jgi:hypothetical protein
MISRAGLRLPRQNAGERIQEHPSQGGAAAPGSHGNGAHFCPSWYRPVSGQPRVDRQAPARPSHPCSLRSKVHGVLSRCTVLLLQVNLAGGPSAASISSVHLVHQQRTCPSAACPVMATCTWSISNVHLLHQQRALAPSATCTCAIGNVHLRHRQRALAPSATCTCRHQDGALGVASALSARPRRRHQAAPASAGAARHSVLTGTGSGTPDACSSR